jgi:Effector-associated domain 11
MTDLSTSAVNARNLIVQGDTGAALQTLQAALKDQPLHTTMARILQNIEADYNGVRQQDLKGILSPQEAQRAYAKVNDSLLSLIEAVETGRPLTVPTTNTSGRKVWLLGAIVLLLLGIGIGWWLMTRGAAATDCPKWEQGDHLKVLIAPFVKLKGEEARPEDALKQRIINLTTKAEIVTSVALSPKSTVTTPSEADAAAKQCGADLVVWGQYAVLAGKDSLRLDLKYKFLKSQKMAQSTGFQGVSDITKLADGSANFRRFDDALFSMCAMLAMQKEKPDFTKHWLEKIKEKNPQEQAILTQLNQSGTQ